MAFLVLLSAHLSSDLAKFPRIFVAVYTKASKLESVSVFPETVAWILSARATLEVVVQHPQRGFKTPQLQCNWPPGRRW